jgi:pseudouridine kinase
VGEHILVIGASLWDTKGKPTAGLEPATTNPARIRSTRGGTARNVAENLGRLGAKVVLVSAVGDDSTGLQLLADTAAAGVDMRHMQVIKGARTGGYMAILDADGLLAVAMDDTAVMENISPAYLRAQEALFETADMVFFDGGISKDAIAETVKLANKYKVPICADPSSSRLAPRFTPYLPHLKLVAPNQQEAAAICGRDHEGFSIDEGLSLARELNQRGVENAVITLADFGLVYATPEENGYFPAQFSGEIVDSTGSGDAIVAAIMFGLINKLETIECMRLGSAAAGLTLQTSETVVPELSLEVLYDHLS